MTAKKKTKVSSSPVEEPNLLPESLSEWSIVLEVRVSNETAAHVRRHLPGMHGGTGTYLFARVEPDSEFGGLTQVYRLKEYLVTDYDLRKEQLQHIRAWLEHAAAVALVDEWACYRILDPRAAELDFHPVDLLFHSDYDYHHWQPFAYLDALKQQARSGREDG